MDDRPQPIFARRLVLATGSHPKPQAIHKSYNASLKVLDLDQCMIKSSLPSLFPANSAPAKIAIIGGSHSGILTCRNFYDTIQEGGIDGTIVNFRRSPIKYAIYTDDGIIHDNSGLKGATADWAKEVLDTHPDEKIIQQIDTSEKEDELYGKYLTECTHIVYATGYERNPVPRMYLGDNRIDEDIEFDMHTSGFRLQHSAGKEGDKTERGLIKGLFGCGIAFPEEVEDPAGNIEAAVGVAKFFKFAERVKGDWLMVR